MSAQLVRGTLVQAVDSLGRWEKARIAKKVGGKWRVSFVDWSSDHDRTFGTDEVRLPIAKHAKFEVLD